MKQYLFLLIIAVVSFAKPSVGQLNKADGKFEQAYYKEAIELYQKVWKKDSLNIDVARQIANSYRMLNNHAEAEKWYERVFLSKKANTEDNYYYFKTLEYNGKHSKSFEDQEALSDEQKRILARYVSTQAYSESLKEDTTRFLVKGLSINSEASDMCPNYYNHELVFSSNRPTSAVLRRTQGENNLNYWNLYSSALDSVSAKNVKLFERKNLKTRFNDGPICFSSDGLEMFITRNVREEGKQILLKLYYSKLANGAWTEPEALPFNLDGYSSAHPSISYDGQTLYFASDRPGGLGGTDIYRCSRENGHWGYVQRLGDDVNTFGDEMFPFVSDDNFLYFSSNGHAGLGGLDLFVKNLSQPKYDLYNLGSPINTDKDDFGFVIKDGNGYLTSNRLGGKGDDDIYAFERTGEFLEAIVLNKKNGTSLDSVQIVKVDPREEFLTNEKGYFKIWIPYNEVYDISFSKKGFKDAFISSRDINEKIYLEPEREVFRLMIIYFAFDKYNINPQGQNDFDQVADYMKKNPDLDLDISAHTDARGSNAYNLKLSKRRALAAKEYLMSKGIDVSRLLSEGYGESNPVNECEDGVDCTEEQHAKNRRIELRFYKNGKVLNLEEE